MSNEWWAFVQQTARGASQHAIARAVGVSASSVNRWRSSRPKPSSVRLFAEAYGVSVIDAMVAAGHLNDGDSENDPSVLREQRDALAAAYADLLTKVRELGGAA